ncbi:hypothetical protein QVD17_04237 [Tagetes erecta]|uniref:Uncharacterized protein n=1 Tax=Tagetes erecta TaxID=13708 RepID=A0AAD8LF50_TARER|nr:hypothetical protein QVD17_04237 [Tagetes erecta]
MNNSSLGCHLNCFFCQTTAAVGGAIKLKIGVHHLPEEEEEEDAAVGLIRLVKIENKIQNTFFIIRGHTCNFVSLGKAYANKTRNLTE